MKIYAISSTRDRAKPEIAYKFIMRAFCNMLSKRTIPRFIHAYIISKSAVFQRVPLGNKMSLNIERKQQDSVNEKKLKI